MISQQMVEEEVSRLYREAAIKLPNDVKKALEDAYHKEKDQVA